MSTEYSGYARPLPSMAHKHFAITPDDDADLPVRPLGLYCEEAGTVAVVDEDGTELSYTLEQGWELPFSAVRVKATGTTATVYGWR
jgi:hypothetical protein